VHRIKRIRRKLGLRCRQKRRFKATTDSRHSLPVAENLLDQKFEASAPNQIWLSDITYIPTEEGWLYLAGHKDLFTGEVVGYAMAECMTKNLVSQSLLRAIAAKRPAEGLIHHSGRGSQYCAQKYSSLLDRFGMRASNRPGKEIATTMPLWKASGACSRTNRSTIAGMQPDKRLYGTLQGTSRFSITGKGNRPGSGSCLRPPLNDGSMKNDSQHKIYLVSTIDNRPHSEIVCNCIGSRPPVGVVGKQNHTRYGLHPMCFFMQLFLKSFYRLTGRSSTFLRKNISFSISFS